MATLQTGSAFVPVIGKCYEVHFGKITLDGQEGYCSARIRVNGVPTSQWEDIETKQPLDHRIGVNVVQGYKEIQCS